MDGTEASAIIVSTDITAPMMEGPKGMALTRDTHGVEPRDGVPYIQCLKKASRSRA
jgi:hypothetical protein